MDKTSRIKKIPTLSTQGWVSTTEEAINKLFDWFVASEYSQTLLFSGKVISLPYLISQYANEPDNLCDAICRNLEELYRRTFDGCAVTARYDKNDEVGSGFDITLSIIITQNGIEYNGGRALKVMNNRVISVISN